MRGFPIQPIGELVYVRRVDDYNGTLVRLDPMNRERKSLRGKVVAAGPGAPRPDGSVEPMAVRENDIVFFDNNTGMECAVDGMDLLVMRASDILCVVERA